MGASSRGNTEVASVVRNDWVERERRRLCKSEVKGRGSTAGLHRKLCRLSTGEGGGIPSVAVKCVDIRRNTSGEGGLLDRN